jgi:hypothetical protein
MGVPRLRLWAVDVGCAVNHVISHAPKASALPHMPIFAGFQLPAISACQLEIAFALRAGTFRSGPPRSDDAEENRTADMKFSTSILRIDGAKTTP